jgi:hypothetical protein
MNSSLGLLDCVAVKLKGVTPTKCVRLVSFHGRDSPGHSSEQNKDGKTR